MLQDIGKGVKLSCHEAPGNRGEQMGHALGGRVSAMCGTEGIVDVHLGERGELGREGGVVRLFSRLEADILDHAQVTVAECCRHRHCGGPDDV